MITKAMEHRLDDIEALLKRIVEQQTEQGSKEEAFFRFQTTGPTALPMTAEHVALALDTTRHNVDQLVYEKRLLRRFSGRAAFHPDDVRAYLSNKQQSSNVVPMTAAGQ